MKAYRVIILGVVGICFTSTRSRAKWIAVTSYRDAYHDYRWPSDLKATRAPEYDEVSDRFGHWQFVNEGIVKSTVKEDF